MTTSSVNCKGKSRLIPDEVLCQISTFLSIEFMSICSFPAAKIWSGTKLVLTKLSYRKQKYTVKKSRDLKWGWNKDAVLPDLKWSGVMYAPIQVELDLTIIFWHVIPVFSSGDHKILITSLLHLFGSVLKALAFVIKALKQFAAMKAHLETTSRLWD